MPRFCSLFFIFGTVLWLFIRYFLPNKHKNEFDGTPCALTYTDIDRHIYG